MRRTPNCRDNALIESFFGKLRTEWIHGKRYATRCLVYSRVRFTGNLLDRSEQWFVTQFGHHGLVGTSLC